MTVEHLWDTLHSALTSIGAFVVGMLLIIVVDAVARKAINWLRSRW